MQYFNSEDKLKQQIEDFGRTKRGKKFKKRGQHQEYPASVPPTCLGNKKGGNSGSEKLEAT